MFFWSFGITLVFFVMGKSNFKELLKSALPVLSNAYWYFGAYTVLFFVIPWINKLLSVITERELTHLAVNLFILFSFVGLIGDPFGIDYGYGYSFSWLIFMYIVGAWIKKCNISEKIKTKTTLIISLLCIAFTWIFLSFSPVKQDMLIKYISPTMVLYGGCMLIVFFENETRKQNEKSY